MRGSGELADRLDGGVEGGVILGVAEARVGLAHVALEEGAAWHAGHAHGAQDVHGGLLGGLKAEAGDVSEHVVGAIGDDGGEVCVLEGVAEGVAENAGTRGFASLAFAKFAFIALQISASLRCL